MPAEQRASSEVSVPSLWQTVRNTDWDPILNEYQSYLITIRQLANPTVRNYMNDLTAFMKFLDENDRIHQIGSLLIGDNSGVISHSLASLGYDKSSISRKLTALRTFFGWMQESGKVPKNDTDTVVAPRQPRRLPSVVSEAEIERLLMAPDTSTALGLRDRALLELIYASGMRVSEVHSLDTTDLDMSARECRVFGKGGKQRIVLLGETAVKWILSIFGNIAPKYRNPHFPKRNVPKHSRRTPKHSQHPTDRQTLRTHGGT